MIYCILLVVCSTILGWTYAYCIAKIGKTNNRMTFWAIIYTIKRKSAQENGLFVCNKVE